MKEKKVHAYKYTLRSSKNRHALCGTMVSRWYVGVLYVVDCKRCRKAVRKLRKVL